MSKLDERRKQYDIPDAPCLPQGKKVIVFRLPLDAEKKTEGGLYVPQDAADPEPIGVLIAAGLRARDVMRDALIEIGDLVWLPRFTTNSPKVDREAGKAGKHVEILNIEDLVGSVDAAARLEREYYIECFETDDGPEHRYLKQPAGGSFVETDLTVKEIAAGSKKINRRAS
jgi:co-chaperonin GroES (HSP10)